MNAVEYTHVGQLCTLSTIVENSPCLDIRCVFKQYDFVAL